MKTTKNFTIEELETIIKNHEWIQTFETTSKEDDEFYEWCKLQIFRKNTFPRKKTNKLIVN